MRLWRVIGVITPISRHDLASLELVQIAGATVALSRDDGPLPCSR
jgi:hypothetical protein